MHPPARDRGATAVEYALGMALFVVVVVGGLQLVQSNADDQLASDRAEIAATEHFGTVASTTSTPSTVPGPTTTASTTTTAPATTSTTAPTSTTLYGGVVTKSCSSDTCSFALNPPATATWSVTPSGSNVISSGSPPGPVTFKKTGTYTITADVAGVSKIVTVVCTSSGPGSSGPITCA